MQNKERKSFFNKRITFSTITFICSLTSIGTLAYYSILKDYFHLSPSQINLYNSIISFSYLLNPLYGLISDNLLICGSRRESYLIIFGFVSSLIYATISCFYTSFLLVLTLQILITFSSGIINSVCQGFLVEDSNFSTYTESDSEKINLNQHSTNNIGNSQKKMEDQRDRRANDNVSLYYFLDFIGIMFISFLSGFLTQNLGFSKVFLLCSLFPFIISIIGFIIYNKGANYKKKLAETFKSRIRRACRYISNKEIFLALIFIFIISLQPSTYDALMYFYINDLEFDYEFIGLTQVFGSIGCLLGITLFNRLCKNINVKKVILYAIIAEIIVNLLQLIQIFKIDYTIFNMNPKIFAIIFQTLSSLIQEMQTMPILVFICILCPINSEAFIYEIGCSMRNLAFSLSYRSGGYLIEIFEISSHNFNNLWVLWTISSLFPILLIPSLFCLKLKDSYKDEIKNLLNLKHENIER